MIGRLAPQLLGFRKNQNMRLAYTFAFLLATGLIQAQVTISTTDENTFVPDMASIDLGGTITFMVMDGHTATQVSEETWLANDNTPLDGGFDFDAGTHVYTPTTDGIIYYVCQPHADQGMKGQVHVINTVGMDDRSAANSFRLFPNPAVDQITLESTIDRGTLIFVDVLGKEVLRTPITSDRKVDISDLQKGNYSVILRDENGTEAGKTRLVITR